MFATIALLAVLAAPAPQAGTCWQSFYGPSEGRQGVVGSRGQRLKPGDCAANLLPYGTRVEVGGRTFTVRDCGAKSNDRVARAKGASIWIDIYTRDRRLLNVTRISKYRVISKPAPKRKPTQRGRR